tara:strand:+ start:99 stop:710 length:612 start_codon:yes stop_codon:yes gene_type:complete
MISLSEIDTTCKRASKAIGFSWGVAEEIGKNMRLLEMFGIPGVDNLLQYFDIYKENNFYKIALIKDKNFSDSKPFCPIVAGLNFLDQINTFNNFKEINFKNFAYPIIFLPFASRASEIIGKKIAVNIDEKRFILSFNQTILTNSIENFQIKSCNNLNINFLDNENTFSEKSWVNLYKLSKKTFVDETDSLKIHSAGAGLTDND